MALAPWSSNELSKRYVKSLRWKWWSLLIPLDKQTYQLRIRRLLRVLLVLIYILLQNPIWFRDSWPVSTAEMSSSRSHHHHTRSIPSTVVSHNQGLLLLWRFGHSGFKDSAVSDESLFGKSEMMVEHGSHLTILLGIVIFPSSSRLVSHATLSTIPPTSNLAVTPIDLEKDDQQSIRG